MRRRCTALAAIAAAALLLAGCGGGSDDEGAATTTGTTTPTGTTAGGCEAVEAPEPRSDGGATAPTGSLDPDVTYALTFVTNCGSFTVTLDQGTAPETAASLVSLARDGFYDDTVFHRIVPGFVIQGGDPTATGSGGPGYQTVDPPPADASYTKGVVAMAKAADEAPGTAGSQFFVVTGDDVGLPPEYAVVGTVTEGQDVVDRIGMLGDPATEAPTEPVVVSTVTIAES
jgi:cyclophilin family peptidyl-prolyl cis-trans isomerase